MNSPGRKVLTAIAVIAMLSTCLIFVPSSSATDYTYGQYGAANKLTYAQIDAKIAEVTGDDIQHWVQKLSDDMEHYDIKKFEPDLHTEISITRDTSVKGHEFTVVDHVSGYIEAKADVMIGGNFPGAGTYDAKDGESAIGLFLRIFKDHGTAKVTDHIFNLNIQMYIDVNLESTIDMDTGEIVYSYVTVKFLMYDKEDRDVDIFIEYDEDSEPEFLSVSYDREQTDSTFYADFEIGFSIEGLKAYSSTEAEWTVTPVITEHVYKSAVSSDLADSLWIKAVDAADGEVGEVQLPKLILKLLGSGGRMMDIFQTIKSLTSSDIPDMAFTGTMKASEYVDSHSYEYCKLESLKEGGPTFMLSTGAYSLNMGRLVNNLPSYIISDGVKVAINIVFAAIGWNDIQVQDISDDTETQAKCSGINDYVSGKIGVVEEGKYSVPTEYIIAAGAGIGISILVGILIWRRVL